MVITDIYDTIMRLLYPSFCLVGGELRVDRKLGGEGMFLVSLADVIFDSYPFLVSVAIPVAFCLAILQSERVSFAVRTSLGQLWPH